MRSIALLFLFSAALATHSCCAAADEEFTQEQRTFVQSKVLPLLEARCFECHKAGKEPKGGLVLSGRKAMLAGGDSGPAIVPGKPEESLLMEAIRYESFEMPPRSRMPKEEVAIFEKWIADGAAWPAELDTDPTSVGKQMFPLQERRDSHWAWQPSEDPSPPTVQTTDWAKDSIDAFVLAKLEQEGFTPAADADRYTLIRRLYFDLIGLPPKVAQVERFVKDPASDDDAIAAVVDELLQSKHFGERWGRHWLDLVRYGETLGHEFDYPLHNAWRYRDYVIRAFNEDVPYDQFVREHIAGDLLPTPRRHPTEQYNESVIGTGFWFLGEDKHAPVDVRAEEAAKIDNQIDVFSKTFLGMTVACARCHDHKFDAISTVDYYALAGFLQSSRRQTAWLDPGKKIAAAVEGLSKTRREAIDIVHIVAEQMPTDQFSKLAQTAIKVVRAPRDFGTVALALAEKNKVDADHLGPWVTALRLKSQAAIEQPLSLPAFLAQADGAVDVSKKIRQWSKKVLSQPPVADTTLFQDLRNGLPDGWFAIGPAFDGDPSHKYTGLSWQKDGFYFRNCSGVSSSTLSPELRGTLASPTFELTHPEILVRVAGQGTRLRLVIDGYVMNEFSELLFKGAKQAIDTDGEYRWIRLAGDVHRHQGHRAHLEFLDEGDGWFAVQEVRFANTAGAAPPPEAPLPMNQTLAKRLAALDSVDAQTAIDEWLRLFTADRTLLAETVVDHMIFQDYQFTTLCEFFEDWSQRATGLPKPVPVLAMTDGTPENERVFIRGNHLNLGDVAPRMLLTALQSADASQMNAERASGSGRLQLAEQILTNNNPLTARVAVNRIWHHLLGRGIVESTDNFGVLGKEPSHPQLLDHLANRFRTDDWSLKKMIRAIVLSRTYRLSTQASPAARDKDPTNQLWHSAAIKRLQGEAVRDAILAVTGRLDETAYGPSVPVHLTKFMQGRGRPKTDGPLDGKGRRSIYILVNRNFLSPFMQAFDVPAPVRTIGKRTVSNVPAQALIMLNNEFVNQQAGLWAKQLLKNDSSSPEDVIAKAWFQLLSRPPRADELRPLLDYYQAAMVEGKAVSSDVLTEICHVLLNTKEFMFLR